MRLPSYSSFSLVVASCVSIAVLSQNAVAGSEFALASSGIGQYLATHHVNLPSNSSSPVAVDPSPQTPTPAPAAAAPAPTGPPAPSTPAMTGPLAANPKPNLLDLGPLGKAYIGGVLSGLALWQDNPANGDLGGIGDLSNGQVFLNKTDGTVQYFLQAGAYSLPSLGTPYMRAEQTTRLTYGALPQGFIKFAPNGDWSFEIGKLPTLLGAEYTFTFENMNIERGLLWNQEPAVSRGAQLNYSKGPLAISASFNDGLYSDVISWVSASIADTLNKNNTISLVGAGNTIHTDAAGPATPIYQNNEQIYNLIYTHTSGPWTVTPYFQYTNVPSIPSIGANASASTTGGAILVNYSFADGTKLGDISLNGVSIPFRVEYISSNGNATSGAPNLLYGPGSNAWSVTVTPTWQSKSFFTRAEFSYTEAGSTTSGMAFGANGNTKSQARLMLEMGIVF